MSWAEFGWPNLSSTYPEPRPLSAPPPRPPVPVDIAAQVRTAERRRGVFVPICALAGAALFGVGLARYRPSDSQVTLALAIMGAGLLVAFVVPALAVLLVIGPHWQQRTQHLELLRWERERRLWRTRERERYLAALSPPQRDTLCDALGALGALGALAAEREPSPRCLDGGRSPVGQPLASP